MQAHEAVRSYLNDLRDAGRRATTLRGYASDLSVLVECAAKHGGALNEQAVSDYLAWPKGRSTATRARRSSSLRGLLRHCDRMILMPTHGEVEPPNDREAERPPHRVLRSEIDAVFSMIPLHEDRDHLLFGLLAHLGLRPSEALALRVEDFEESSASLSVDGWGGKRRRVLVDDRQIYLRLTNYLLLTASPSGPLFTASGRETPLRYQSVQHRWAQYCSQAGVDVKLSDLRRAHVADLVSGGVPEAIIRERIGQAAGALEGTHVSFSNAESDAEIRAWQERRDARRTAPDGTLDASERRVG